MGVLGIFLLKYRLLIAFAIKPRTEWPQLGPWTTQIDNPDRLVFESRVVLACWVAFLLAAVLMPPGGLWLIFAAWFTHVYQTLWLSTEHTGLPSEGSILARTRGVEGLTQLSQFNTGSGIAATSGAAGVGADDAFVAAVGEAALSHDLAQGIDGIDDGPEPTFVERQTLGEVFREIVGLVCAFSAEHEHDFCCGEAEVEQLDTLLRKYSRRVTSLLLSFGVAKNWNRSCDMFRETLRLLTRMVDDRLNPVRTIQPETETAEAGEKVVLNFYN
jgi:hypothetical protein